MESSYEDISKDLGVKEPDTSGLPSLPEEDITPLCLWLKDIMHPYVGKVTLSRRLKDVPLVLFGQVSAGMRNMMAMM